MLADLQEGQWVERTPISDPRSLTPILRRYNCLVATKNEIETQRIVTLRDLLAHGRTFGLGSSPLLSIVKFGREPNEAGRILVEKCVEMNQAWFDNELAFVGQSLGKIVDALAWEQLHTWRSSPGN